MRRGPAGVSSNRPPSRSNPAKRPFTSSGLAPDADTADTGRPEELEFRIQTRTGETRWIGHVCQPVVGEDGTYLGRRASNRDVTARRQAAEERLALLEQNLRLQKSQSLAQMAGGVAHVLNNQLTVVLNSLDLAETSGSATERQDRLVSARRATDKSVEIGRFLLTYLGQLPGQRGRADLVAICREALTERRDLIPSSVTVDMTLNEPGPSAVVDAAQIRDAVARLIENACDAIGHSTGSLHLSVGLTTDTDLAHWRHSPDDWTPGSQPYAAVSVTDSGEGIPAAHLEQLFDPFFTTRFPGRGLGLTIVAAAARDHGGVVAIRSDAHGTVARLLLPVNAPAAAGLS